MVQVTDCHKNIYYYASLSKALDNLNEQGFNYNFNIHEENLAKKNNNYEIVPVYRHEGDSNPDDEVVIFGIKLKSGKEGVFVSGYSANF